MVVVVWQNSSWCETLHVESHVFTWQHNQKVWDLPGGISVLAHCDAGVWVVYRFVQWSSSEYLRLLRFFLQSYIGESDRTWQVSLCNRWYQSMMVQPVQPFLPAGKHVFDTERPLC
jgi:hypothetical protein